MPTYFLLLLLLTGGWTLAEQQESPLDSICSPSTVSAPKVSPMAKKSIHYTNKALFLTYHHLDDQESFITITPNKFKQHLQVLQDNQYNVITIEDYACFHAHRKALPPNAVVITFDDGYRSFYEKAYPMLKQMGYPATNFVIVSDVDSDNPSLPFLTWPQIVEMKRDGFSFYSHTYDLHQKKRDEAGNLVPPLTNRIYLPKEQRMESEEEKRQRVGGDLLLGEALLRSKLHNQLSLLCFPLGEYNQPVIDDAKQLGFSLFLTTREGINTGSSEEITRISAGMPYVSADILLKKLLQYDQK
ncbi:polysaccharide deacetylase family protein [Paenibacillus sp. HWE-109]|uniref:polysaccharide deacetylase family protein n=1 Tax=Paenibacillus sp. HWE-109 TaxID=1306526 RepID=UPI001EE07192|nr:polysaccharide deacetylase family protein [Paenibacillus sp. HWE-109]UKS29721.1 polysaccharide deacetylase family protein [Paenibacillus sp. HWE-109]